MIKKISNWVFGSFFRTAGRLLFFIILGFIIAQIIKSNDFNVDFTDLLGIAKVSALTITSEVQPSGSEVWTQSNQSGFNSDDHNYYFEMEANTTMNDFTFIPTDDSALHTNEDYIEIPFYYSYPSLQIANTYTYNETVCSAWRMSNNYWSCENYIQPRNEIPVAIATDIDSFTFQVKMQLANDNWVNCSMQNTDIVCPLYKQKPKKLMLVVNYIQYSATRIRFGFSKTITYYKSSNSVIQETIENTTQEQIESQIVCQNKILTEKDFTISGSLDSNGNVATGGVNVDFKVTNYMDLKYIKKIQLKEKVDSGNSYICFYNESKVKTRCISQNGLYLNQVIQINNEDKYVRFTYKTTVQLPKWELEYCQNGNQAIQDSINNSDTSEADNSASSFFSNFTTQDNGGISSIITAPLSAISGLVNSTCTQIELPLPYVNTTVILPCMSAIYTEHFGSLFTLYQTIIFGAVAYRILLSIFAMIQGFKNPDNDRIEVVDL